MTEASLLLPTHPDAVLAVQFISTSLDPKFCNHLLDLPSNNGDAILDAQVNEHWSNDEVLPDETPEPFDTEPSICLAIKRCKSLSFGRDSSCTVPLPARRGISKKHFRLYLSPYSTWMLTCNSRNALLLNGVWVGKKSSRALDPSIANNIEIPSVSVRIVVHVLNERVHEVGYISAAPVSAATEDVPLASTEVAEDWSASGSTSTVTHLRWVGDARQSDTCSAYIVLTTAPMAWSSSAFCAIDATTGEECVALRFKAEDSRRLVRFFLSYGQRLHHMHIVRSLKVERDPPLLAQSFNGRDFLRPGSVSVDTACTAIRQITDALHTAHSMGFVHGYIRAEDVIYQRADLRYQFVLNGFWRRFMDQNEIEMPRPCSDADKEHDYRALSEVVMAGMLQSSDSFDRLPARGHSHCLSSDGRSIKDYILREVLLAMRNTKSVDGTWAYIQNLPPHHDGSHFSMIEVTRSISTELRGTGRNAELPTAQVIKLWEYHLHGTRTDRDTISVEDSHVLGLLRRYKPDFIRASKLSTFLRLATSDTAHLRAALDAAIRRSATEIMFEIPLRIPCIGEFINLTCFSRATGIQIARDLSHDAVQEVRGPYSRAGLYVSFKTLKDVASKADCGMLTWRSQPQQTSFAQDFCDVDARKFVLFTTGLPWCAFVLMRRDDGMLDWDPFSQTSPAGTARFPLITVDESCSRCDELGLSDLKQAILAFDAAPCRDLPSSCLSEGTNFGTEDNEESDTSIETEESDQDNLKFKRRKT